MTSPIQQLSAKLRLPSTISTSDDGTDRIPLIAYPSYPSTITAHETSKDNLPAQPSPLGSPTKKRRINFLDLIALAIALGSSAVAITTVRNDALAWKLRFSNQLVVVGFLLSIMNQCLAPVVPFLSLLLETRFGSSTIQNYEGILSNQFLKGRMHFVWRMAIIFFLALPLALSAGYKRFFPNGSATISLYSADITGLTPSYGLFPTITEYHHYDALSIYFNATIHSSWQAI